MTKKNNRSNSIVLGPVGIGKAYHPWDNLKNCICGGKPWMEGKDGNIFEEGKPYRIKCCKCGKHTNNGDITDVKNEWNNILAESKLV